MSIIQFAAANTPLLSFSRSSTDIPFLDELLTVSRGDPSQKETFSETGTLFEGTSAEFDVVTLEFEVVPEIRTDR